MSVEAWQSDREQLRRYFDYPVPDGQSEAAYWGQQGQDWMVQFALQEQLFERMFAQKRQGSFLEIGIGDQPVTQRIGNMIAHDIAYTGLDFAWVCERHQPALEAAVRQGLKFRLLGNRTGTYLFNLVELARAGERFDAIYFDGHHTMYVDAGPLLVAASLLAPDGILAIDDIAWSLSLVARNMYFSYQQWAFYRQMYNFDLYEPAQVRENHIGMLVDAVLVGRIGFVPDPALACLGKAVLRRGADRVSA